MRSNSSVVALLAVFFLIALSACGNGSNSPATPTEPGTGGGCPVANTSCTNAAGNTLIPTSNTSSVPVYVADTNTTGPYGYINEPLVSVTICSPNHTSPSQCQTISNILVDTGSFGLRVFGSAINSNVQLTQQVVNVQGQNMNLAECAIFGTGADWGAIQNGDVTLGNQTATDIPIHVINAGFASVPSGCAALCPDQDPCTAGYNGILGVGLFAEDCGSSCASSDSASNPGIYFACDSTGCYDAYPGNCGSDHICVIQVPANQQVVNPVARFATGFNNGIALTMPSIGDTGASSMTSGVLQLGIGTPTSVAVYDADPNGMTNGNGSNFQTTFQGTTFGGSSSNPSNPDNPSLAYIDSGSNVIAFPSTITLCSDGSGLYCPPSNQSLSAVVAGFSGSPTGNISFSAANADSLTNTNNTAFNNITGASVGQFDWGLPFFFGRTVYVGLDGTSATINSSSETGPYWAF